MRQESILATKIKAAPAVSHTQAAAGGWLPPLVLGIYCLMQWATPLIPVPSLRWYAALAFAIFILLFLRISPLNFTKIRFYVIFIGLTLAGVIISLPRSLMVLGPEDMLNNLTSFLVSAITVGLFAYGMTFQRLRSAYLVALVAAGTLWAIYVGRIQAQLGVNLGHYTFVDQFNKNAISVCLVLSYTALLAFAVLWQPKQPDKQLKNIARILAFGLAIYIGYHQPLTYSRSGLISLGVGTLAVAGLLLLRRYSLLRTLFFLSVFTAVLYVIVPRILSVVPAWNGYFSSQFIGARDDLVYKGLLIIQDNPIMGIGLGGTKPVYSSEQEDTLRGLIHNTYLTAWSEIGLLGILAYILWGLKYYQVLKNHFWHLSMSDQVFLVMMVPFFFQETFINNGGAAMMVLAVFVGLLGSIKDSKRVIR